MTTPTRPEEVTEEHIEVAKAVLNIFREAVEKNEPYARNVIDACETLETSLHPDPNRSFYLDDE